MSEQEQTIDTSGLETRVMVAVVVLLACVALAMISIINGKELLAGVFAVAGVSSHLIMWRLLNRRQRLLGDEGA